MKTCWQLIYRASSFLANIGKKVMERHLSPSASSGGSSSDSCIWTTDATSPGILTCFWSAVYCLMLFLSQLRTGLGFAVFLRYQFFQLSDKLLGAGGV